MEISTYAITPTEDENIILGMSHFIKTVEDIYEIMVNSSPSIKFGLGFCEASQDRLVRSDGNDKNRQFPQDRLPLCPAWHSSAAYRKKRRAITARLTGGLWAIADTERTAPLALPQPRLEESHESSRSQQQDPPWLPGAEPSQLPGVGVRRREVGRAEKSLLTTA